jgi:Spy/CpxP family protein refolding chaperone
LKRKLGLLVAAAALLMLPLMPRLVRAQTNTGTMESGGMMSNGGMGMGRGGMMGHGGMGGISPLPIFLRAADLTPAQQDQVNKILLDNRTAAQAQFEKMHSAREAIAAKLFSTGPLTAKDLSAQTGQIAQAQQQMLQNELNMALQVRAVLTPAQLKKVSQLHAKFESLHKQMRALMGPPPGDAPPPADAPPPPPPG